METPTGSAQQAPLSDYLAAERTFLAWIRTGLSLMGFGFVVARFGLFLAQIQVFSVISGQKSYGLSLWFGTALIVAGVVLNAFAGAHHLRLIRRLDRGETVSNHSTAAALTLAFFLAAVGITMTIYFVSIRA